MSGSEGSIFGRYLLLKRIASGGMGEIYLAKLKGPVGFEKLLVIKRILQHHLEKQEFVDMFFGEARVAAQLTHANIVQIYEMGQIDDCYYIAMEYVHGKALRDILDCARARGEYLHPAHVTEIIAGICRGMSYAHNATNMSGDAIGVIHRDINPHNVLVSYSGEVKVIDFGIAKSQLSLHKTQTGTIKGKFVYMSPEQSASRTIDKRSDIFSIGICTYEALTFINPFARDNLVLSMDAIQNHDPPPLEQTSVRLAPLDPVIAKALAKSPDERYADCADFGRALEAVRDEGSMTDPRQSLAAYMHDLFEEQIEHEQRVILDTDSAKSSQIHAMQQGLEREHQSGSHGPYRLKTPSPSAILTSRASPPAPVPPSRWPVFLILLLATAVVSSAGAAIVFKVLDDQPSTAKATGTEVVVHANEPATTTRIVMNPEPPAEGNAISDEAVDDATEDEDAVAANEAMAATTGGVDDDASKGETVVTTPNAVRSPAAVELSGRPAVPAASLDEHRSPKSGKQLHADKGQTPSTTAAPATSALPASVAAAFGNLQISTYPPVKITHRNVVVGQTFKLDSATGSLVFGTGQDRQSDPFVVRIRYTIGDGSIKYTVESKPWAIVKNGSGIGLGKTPLPPQLGGEKTVFEFINPKERLTQRITLQYTR